MPAQVAVTPEALAIVRTGLLDAVRAEYGRAHEFAIDGYPFAGKTGGSNAPPRQGATLEELDTWFVAYAPPDHPKTLVAARLERVQNAKDTVKLVAEVLRSLR